MLTAVALVSAALHASTPWRTDNIDFTLGQTSDDWELAVVPGIVAHSSDKDVSTQSSCKLGNEK